MRVAYHQSVSYLPYQTTLNIFCDIGFSFFCSTSACAFLNSSIRFNSSSASSNPICVYTFIVTDISECPIRNCSVLGFIPDFAIFEQFGHCISIPEIYCFLFLHAGHMHSTDFYVKSISKISVNYSFKIYSCYSVINSEALT